AAAIMGCVFLAVALASVVTIKSIGVGMAVAVIVAASLVRALVVPAAMGLLGTANWWAPRWLRRRDPLPQEIPPAACHDLPRRTPASPAPPRPSLRGLTHLATVPLAIAGAITLVVVGGGDLARQISLGVYGVCLVLLF